jgi:hypothetical protein
LPGRHAGGHDEQVTIRPLLLVDVDGVLNPYAAFEPLPGYEAHEFLGEGFAEVLLAREHGAWLTSLADVYELVWATSWMHLANWLICPVLGLPELPVIEFPRSGDDAYVKLPSVIRSVGDRACAWIDDVHHPEHFAWAEKREAPTLLLHIDPSRGLQRDHVDRLREWGTAQVNPA